MKVFRYCIVLARRNQKVVSLLSAFLLSLGLWYFINVQDFLETQMEVNIDYAGTPPNLVVTGGLVHKATLRLRGPQALVRAAANERPVNTINLSHIKRGETVVPLIPEEIPKLYRAFEVVDFQPRQIIVRADNLVERSVPVRVVLNSPLQGKVLKAGDAESLPSAVQLRGPETLLKSMPHITLPITINPTAKGQVEVKNVTLNPPPMITAVPQSVNVTYTITSERTPVSKTKRVQIAASNAKDFEISPAEITLWVDVPDALTHSNRYFDQIKVSVTPPELEPGESGMVTPDYSLPEGMLFLDANIERIRVTRKRIQEEKD